MIPANRPSFFSCTDSGSGIAGIAWDSSLGVVQWTEQGNGTWIAPTISQNAVQLVILDRVGNERRTNYAVIRDSSPPVPSIAADNAFINLMRCAPVLMGDSPFRAKTLCLLHVKSM